jgi:transcriptional regulator with XRE-family HTH domain
MKNLTTKGNISGDQIRQARERLGMSQIELAVALSVDFAIQLDQSDISEIERRVRGLKDFELYALSVVLEVSPLWLLTGDENV